MIISLELRWIHKKAKDLVYPHMVFVEKLDNCSGCFYGPMKDEFFVHGNYYDFSKGIIFIGERQNSNEISNIIAHEWRHYWQVYNCAPHPVTEFNSKIGYEKAIAEYFKSPYERDAHNFAHRFSPSPVSEYWTEIINANH